jgi:hypothetical protein
MPPIFAHTATTLDGLAVQAAAATLACADLWDCHDPADEAGLDVERQFIEAVCRYTGVAHPAINREWAKAMPADGARLKTYQKTERHSALADAFSHPYPGKEKMQCQIHLDDH